MKKEDRTFSPPSSLSVTHVFGRHFVQRRLRFMLMFEDSGSGWSFIT